jgi:DNA-directed RNA polymerase subunit K/omega
MTVYIDSDNESENESENESDNESDNESEENVKYQDPTIDDDNDDNSVQEDQQGKKESIKFVGGGADIYGDDEDDEIEVDDDDDVEEEYDDDEDDGEENNMFGEQNEQGTTNKKPKKTQTFLESDDDEDDEDDTEENYLQKFDTQINKNYIFDYHPECISHNYDEISSLTKVVRDSDNIIIDPLHTTLPFLTKYERARILGQRAKQLETGAKPFISIPENIIESNLIAELELQQKKIPFIIRRPLPNGGFEYWNLKDLEIISF